jgi:broad specificity phosphatase PhoE
VIRAALVWALGMPLDLIQRIEIDPASVSAVRIEDWGPTVLYINVSADMLR